MGRNCHGPKLTWADFVMGRNDPEPKCVKKERPSCFEFEKKDRIYRKFYTLQSSLSLNELK